MVPRVGSLRSFGCAHAGSSQPPILGTSWSAPWTRTSPGAVAGNVIGIIQAVAEGYAQFGGERLSELHQLGAVQDDLLEAVNPGHRGKIIVPEIASGILSGAEAGPRQVAPGEQRTSQVAVGELGFP